MVENDMRVVAGSDWVIDVGPGAGEDGGTAGVNAQSRTDLLRNSGLAAARKNTTEGHRMHRDVEGEALRAGN